MYRTVQPDLPAPDSPWIYTVPGESFLRVLGIVVVLTPVVNVGDFTYIVNVDNGTDTLTICQDVTGLVIESYTLMMGPKNDRAGETFDLLFEHIVVRRHIPILELPSGYRLNGFAYNVTAGLSIKTASVNIFADDLAYGAERGPIGIY